VKTRFALVGAILVPACAAAGSPSTCAPAASGTQRVSVSSNGVEADRDSNYSDVSGNGEFVVFESFATHLVEGDDNRKSDVFLYGSETSVVSRVSVRSNGREANGPSYSPSISRNGRYIAFTSQASNLASHEDHYDDADIFVHDRVTGTTERVSVRSRAGAEANDDSHYPVISDNGRFVTFQSFATNLDPHAPKNYYGEVYVYDRRKRTTERVSVPYSQAKTHRDGYPVGVSNDGNIVAFTSEAANLVVGDTNHTEDVFVFDRAARATRRVSIASDGTQADGKSTGSDISPDGRFVVFDSYAANLVRGDANDVSDVFVYDLTTGSTTRISETADGVEGDGDSVAGRISADGRYVAFSSLAADLVPGDTNAAGDKYHGSDVFLKDRSTGSITRESVATDGSEADGSSFVPAISADGRYLSFPSNATNLAPRDTNDSHDVFLRGPTHRGDKSCTAA
jgi:Tol biopolymer transport system component